MDGELAGALAGQQGQAMGSGDAGQQGGNLGGAVNTASANTGAEPSSGTSQGGANGAGTGGVKLEPWAEQLPRELRENQETAATLSKFKAVGELAKSYVELEKKLGESIAPLRKNAKAEDAAAFWEKLGRPKTKDGYSIAKEKEAGALLDAAFEANLTDGQAQALYERIGKLGEAQLKQVQERQSQQLSETTAALRKEFGAEYMKHYAYFEKGLGTIGKEAVDAIQSAGIAGNPGIVRALMLVGEAVSEGNALARGGTAGKGFKPASEGGWYTDYGSKK